MRNNTSKNNKTKASSKKVKDESRSHEYETMSQRQNRYGNGRERSGSDGGSTQARGSNH
jgi:hypothetical protein